MEQRSHDEGHVDPSGAQPMNAEPAQAAQPAQPVEPAQAAQPVEPAQAAQPVEPVEPAQPGPALTAPVAPQQDVAQPSTAWGAPTMVGASAAPQGEYGAPPQVGYPNPNMYHYAGPYGPAAAYAPGAPYQPAPIPAQPAKSGRGWIAAGIGGLAAGAIAIAIALGAGGLIDHSSTDGAQQTSNGPVLADPYGGFGGTDGSGGFTFPGGSGQLPGGGSGSGGTGSGGSTSESTQASAQQTVGVVNINTVLGYQNGEAAGTGMILTSDGLVLTNNHVVAGSTKIQVTDITSGKTYDATVVGTAPSQDIAVIQLSNASGLKTANFGSASSVKVGDSIVAVGNAGGTGTPSAATGKVTALNQSITATDENGSNAEQLTGLIQNDADVVGGDSGGPLYDSSGKIIGINTAGASTNEQSTQDESYAIPIDHALDIAKQINSGVDNDTIHQGLPAFLGVSMAQSSGGNRTGGGAGGSTGAATIAGTIDGTPAAALGLQAGDTITGIDNHQVASSSDLTAALGNYKPGDTVTVTWTDSSGQSHSGKATLIAGPAD